MKYATSHTYKSSKLIHNLFNTHSGGRGGHHLGTVGWVGGASEFDFRRNIEARGSLPRARANARSVAALTENPGCTRRRVIDSAAVSAHELAAKLGHPTLRGQSPFAIEGGNRFEDRLKRRSHYELLVDALAPYVELPKPPDLVVEDVNRVGRLKDAQAWMDARAKRTDTILAKIARGDADAPHIVDHPVLRFDLAGVTVNLEPDALAFRIGDKLELVETMPASAAPMRDWPARDRARVLISGHSLTDNPLGDYVAKLAQQHARDYGWEQQIVIGSPVRYRTRGDDSHDPNFSGYSLGKNRDSFEKNILHELAMPTGIGADEHYETLVITERHDILGVIGGEDTVPLLRHYHDRLREHAAETRTLFYQSWPEIDLAKLEAWIAYQSKELGAWECAASKVNLSLERDAAAPTVTVVPVAVALAKFVERVLAGAVPELGSTQQERLSAIFMDDVHLTALGAYLAAAATYSAVFASTPAGVEPPSNVNASAAALASEVAWEVVSTYYRSTAEPWRRSMEDCRNQLSALCPEC